MGNALRVTALASIAVSSLASPAAIADGSAGDEASFHTSADLGFGMVDEDGFVLVSVEQGISADGFELVLSGPLRFLVADRSPEDGGVLRRQDWDEPSDFARIARSASYRHEWPDAVIDLEVGELNGVGIGHGSVVDCYFNSIDLDHYQGGAILTGEWAGSSIEMMVENVVEPEILAARIQLAPAAWFSDGKWARRFALAGSIGADIAPPTLLETTGASWLPVVGADLSATLADEPWGAILVYGDLNVMDGEPGAHAGLATSWTLSRKEEVALHLRGEYRYLGSDYHPAVFNPFYESTRRLWDRRPDTGEPRSLADHLADAEDPTAHGLMADAAVTWARRLRLSLRYDSEGEDRPHWILARLDISVLDDRLGIGALYAARDPRRGLGVFSVDALMGAGIQARIWGPLRAFVEYERRTRRVGAKNSWANAWSGGVGCIFEY